VLERSLAVHRSWAIDGARQRAGGLAALACDRSQWPRAAHLLHEATEIRAALSIPVPPCEFPLLRRTRAALSAAKMSRTHECGG